MGPVSGERTCAALALGINASRECPRDVTFSVGDYDWRGWWSCDYHLAPIVFAVVRIVQGTVSVTPLPPPNG
jgi:hypothetical protein